MSSDYYKNQKRSKEQELSDYKKRKSQLEEILKIFQNDFNDNISYINKQERKISEYLKQAIAISGKGFETEAIAEKRLVESLIATLSDSSMSDSYHYVSKENERVRMKIEEIENEIGSLNAKISEEETKEKEEKLEKLRELLGGS